MVQESDNFGAKQDKRGIAPSFAWGIGTRDEFSIGAYYLTTEGRPIYNHPGACRLTARSTPRCPRAISTGWKATTTTPNQVRHAGPYPPL